MQTVAHAHVSPCFSLWRKNVKKKKRKKKEVMKERKCIYCWPTDRKDDFSSYMISSKMTLVIIVHDRLTATANMTIPPWTLSSMTVWLPRQIWPYQLGHYRRWLFWLPRRIQPHQLGHYRRWHFNCHGKYDLSTLVTIVHDSLTATANMTFPVWSLSSMTRVPWRTWPFQHGYYRRWLFVCHGEHDLPQLGHYRRWLDYHGEQVSVDDVLVWARVHF